MSTSSAEIQSVGKSLTFRGAAFEASELMKTHRCKDPICDTHLWKVRHELDMAKMKMRNLEAELQSKGIQDPLLRNSFDGSIGIDSSKHTVCEETDEDDLQPAPPPPSYSQLEDAAKNVHTHVSHQNNQPKPRYVFFYRTKTPLP